MKHFLVRREEGVSIRPTFLAGQDVKNRPTALPGHARKIAKVAMARKLAIELYWMRRRSWDYDEMQKLGSHAGEPGHRHGVQ